MYYYLPVDLFYPRQRLVLLRTTTQQKIVSTQQLIQHKSPHIPPVVRNFLTVAMFIGKESNSPIATD